MSGQTAKTKKNWFEAFFKVKERGSNVPREILGGIVVFLVTCCNLPVNAAIMNACGMDAMGVYASTALCAAVVTIIMALLSNAPFVLCAAMGINAYVAYTVCSPNGLGLTWQEGMILETFAGFIFLIISITPIRRKMIEAFPKDIRHIIAGGLGAFIAFIGLKNSGVVIHDESTLIGFGSLSDPVVLLSVIGIVLVIGLMFAKTKRGLLSSLAIPIGMLITAVIGVIIYYATGASNESLPHFDFSSGWGLSGLKEVFLYGLFGSETNGALKGSDFWTAVLNVLKNPVSYAAIFSIVFVSLFNTTAVLFSVGKDCDLIDEESGAIKRRGAFVADSMGVLLCGPMGTSVICPFAESAIGVKVGARTGLGGLTIGISFAIAAFIFPVFRIFTYSCVSCATLVAVGALIFVGNLGEINWKDPASAFSAFITVIMIVLTCSLTTGLGLGLIVYISIMLFSRRGKEINWILYLIGAFYILSFAVDELVKKMA